MGQAMREKQPSPQFAEIAEAIIPAAAMLLPDFWESALRLPEPEDFDDTNLAALWTAVLEAHRRGPITKMAVARELRDMGWSDRDSFAALERARTAYLTIPEALACIDLILQRRLRRRAERVLGDALKDLRTAHDVQAVVHRAEISLADVAGEDDGAGGAVRGTEVTTERLERLETGMKDIDRVSGGLASSVLTLVAARTGMGKSAFMATLLLNVSRRGLGALCDELEMPSIDLINRCSSAQAYRTCRPAESRRENPFYSDYEAGLLQGEMRERFETAREVVRQLPIWWNDRQGRTSSQIRLGARRVRLSAEREGVDLRLIVVDHLGKIYPDKSRDSRHIELGEISNSLMEMAAELKLPVVALAQLNRSVESRQDKRPMISDLRESGRLEEDAHTILTLYRQAYYDDAARERGEDVDADKAAKERFILEANFVKNRGGPLRRVKLFCDIGANAILDRAVGFEHVNRAPHEEGLFA